MKKKEKEKETEKETEKEKETERENMIMNCRWKVIPGKFDG